ncbi:MAG: glycogen synthase GlgA [Fusobacteriaceae bacterium]|mgnify:FL=1|nr:glycogen synthase GlgA [Fusobacteriaceae bacterium]
MNIAFVASEMYPLIKTGGLADVAYALPKALNKMKNDVRVFIPKYSKINNEYLKDSKYVTSVDIYNEIYNIISVEIDGITVYLVENRTYFERDSLYDCWDNDIQFATFCEVVLISLEKIGFKPHVINCNDWQTGVLPYFLNARYKFREFYKDIKTLYTIHNLRFQGHFSKRSLEHHHYQFEDNYVNFMKIAILNSDKINTVSETYAQEIKTHFFGEGLDYYLRMRDHDLSGIVNGIDIDVFNPETDKSLVKNYNLSSFKNKLENKRALQKEFGLPISDNTPIISMVTRLDPQKGLDLLDHVIKEIMNNDAVQIIILGSGHEKYEKKFSNLAKKYPDKLGVYIGYNGALANRIYAGSDMYLMPSHYEPCGLSQLISLRYGTIPIVRETGGLNDTVQAYNEFTHSGNGFSFKNYNAHDMLHTIRYAEDFYYNKKDLWNSLIKTAMSSDYSWEQSAEKYLKLYKSI